jgi:hypothetical protein
MNRDELREQQTRPASAVSELYQDLELILERSERLVASGRDEQIHEMARYLAALRSLLADLLAATGEHARGHEGAALEQLVSRFLTIEGKVKEIRNDRALSGKGN